MSFRMSQVFSSAFESVSVMAKRQKDIVRYCGRNSYSEKLKLLVQLLRLNREK